MTSQYVHIVCLDAPAPANYGGAIDMYAKIMALHSVGRKIILHYFKYKENRNAEGLEAYCEEINVYGRTSFFKSLVTHKPYIVSSRIEPDLIHRLNRDDFPVLLEGVHCTGIIPHLNFHKKLVVRMHNDEAVYYRMLYNNERNFLKRLYFLYESALLSKYQKGLPRNATYAFISLADMEVFKKTHTLHNQFFVPSFVPWQTISSKSGKGSYCLYHGNISISENYEAAVWLAENIFSQIGFPLIIAGRDAKGLEGRWTNKNIQLINDPSDDELTMLIQNAHINVLPSINVTGVKLKLLHALFEGRFCIANHNGLAGSGVENYVTTANTKEEWISAVKQKMLQDFSAEQLEERKQILSIYNNSDNAQKLSALL